MRQLSTTCLFVSQTDTRKRYVNIIIAYHYLPIRFPKQPTLPLLQSDIQNSRERSKQTAPSHVLLMFLDVDSMFFNACSSNLTAIDLISSAS